jgi:adenylate cyclase
MTRSSDKITRKLKAKKKALLKDYNEEDLHKLRVNIRRARALLKQNPGKHSATIRKEWSKLADRTNAARDWDTLAIYAAGAQHSRQWQSLQPLVEDYRGRARRKVLATLDSDHWDITLVHWQKLVKRVGKNALCGGELDRGNQHAAHRALRASQRALKKSNDRNWHKFRIAVKNLRYTLEGVGLQDTKCQPGLKTIKKLCKSLQDELGDWHDTVVHQGLLDSIAADPGVAGSADVRTALDSLEAIIEARRTECLHRVVAILDHDGQILAAAAGESTSVEPPHKSLEIERKFLVDTDRLGTLNHGEEIVQGFIVTNNATAVRIRVSGDSAWITIKGESIGARRAEFEYTIPTDDALLMLNQLCVGITINKTRYRHSYRGHVWEIDVFHGENGGLVMAEVELQSETESVDIPDWATREVTGDQRYYNVELAFRPYSQWRDD